MLIQRSRTSSSARSRRRRWAVGVKRSRAVHGGGRHLRRTTTAAGTGRVGGQDADVHGFCAKRWSLAVILPFFLAQRPALELDAVQDRVGHSRVVQPRMPVAHGQLAGGLPTRSSSSSSRSPRSPGSRGRMRSRPAATRRCGRAVPAGGRSCPRHGLSAASAADGWCARTAPIGRGAAPAWPARKPARFCRCQWRR